MNGFKLALFALFFIPILIVAEEERSLEGAGFIFDRYPPVNFSAPAHFFVSITVSGNEDLFLTIEDGSTWKINQYDNDKVRSWRENDALLITENQRWFSNYSHRIIHKDTGSYVEANLLNGSF